MLLARNIVLPILSGIQGKANAIAGTGGLILGCAREGGLRMNKIPVWKTIASGYGFTFGQLGTIIGLIWLPMVIAAVAGYFVMSQYYSAFPAAMEQGDAAAAGQAALLVIGWSIVSLVLSSIMYSAVTRQALGERRGPALIAFQFGSTELRVFGAILALFFLLIVFLVIYLMLAGMGAFAAKALLAGLPQKAQAAAVGLYALALLAAIFFVMVRLSFLMIPAAVAEGNFGLVRSWQLSEGNFWRILLVGLLTLAPLLAVMLAAEVAILGPDFFMPHNVAPGDADAQLKDMIAQMRAAAPHMPLLYGFSFLVAPLATGLGLAPAAFAYRALKGDTAGN